MPNDTVKPAWLLGPAREPIDRDVSKRIDVLRIILIGLIVLAHGARGVTVRIGGPGPATDFMLEVFNRHVDFVGVPLFFAISGFLFLRKFELSLAAYGDMLRKKFVSLLIPYLLFNLGLAAWLYFVGSIEMIGSWRYLVEEGFFAKVLGIGTLPLVYPLWFLRDLLLVFLLSPVLLVLFKEAPNVGLITLFVLWTGLSPAAYSYYGDFFAFYLGGYLARARLPLMGVSWWQRAGSWGFVALTAVLVFRAALGLPEGVYQFLFKCNLVLGLVFFWRMAAFPAIRDSWVLHRSARHSFFVYLAHEPTISTLQTRLLAVWQPAGDAQQIAFYWLSGLATIVLLWGVAEVLDRFVPAFYAIITGSRRAPAKKPEVQAARLNA